MSDAISRAVDDYINDRLKQVTKDFYNTLNYVNEELVKEAQVMYDTFIDQFYAYQTSSYSRHGVGIGTQTGSNLYRGQDIKSVSKGKIPGVSIEFSADKMAGNYHHGYSKFKQDSPEDVLNMVLLGWRFPYPDFRHFGDGLSWSGEYHGKYFEFSGTPFDAFQKFEKDYNDNGKKIFDKVWDQLGW